VPPAGAEQYEPFYMPLTGTSMSSPHVAGAVAVIQSKAVASLGRRLTPAEVRSVLVGSATPMTGVDGLWDWPCGQTPLFVDCGAKVDGTTGKAYERWQVGAGYLNVAGALDRVPSLGAATASGGAVATGEAPAALPSAPPPGASSEPVRTTLPLTGRALAQRRAALKRCRTKASRKKTRRARTKARAKCKARYG
jgi:subtilisin family serine protease